MSLYQASVLKNYTNQQEKQTVEKAYKKYTKYFLDAAIQENIRNSKEEEYQGIFLTELFVNILDYTLKPKVDFNLVAEYKNQNNARKADGAILQNDIAVGVIELKGTNTKDLESIRKQAFDYKANQKGCVYVITSNFEKLRFYINDATEYEEFNLFDLSAERFALLHLCLQKDNILNNVPLKIKEASIVKEEQITKEFYKDYSLFKRELYRDLVKQNAKRLKTEASLRGTKQSHNELSEQQKTEQQQLDKNVKLTLFKKSQKLIDRFLFIFFAEDRSLLPANSTELILQKWKADVDFGDERPLYDLFKQYFNFLDKGRQGTKSRGEIYAYNGGLFKEDTLLDGLEIDNDLLYKHTHKLAGYDFESQVDVNILGHIFENSLNEIESVNAEIEGADFDKQTSKRKKDGVFYTPKYITKYIVENTVGKLCTEKKTDLGIKEEEYFKGRKNRNKATIVNLVTLLDTYRDWLLQLTICDPACGSGAFLNQALDFLIKEHTYIDELKTKVLGGGLQFSDIENTILENNIYGVDLNEESVEIAKLSLWLRTAQPRRKLNDLSSNIKCGNSLIVSKTVAGDKAFNWEEQFPQVFKKGGFDVIIGNPPYVRVQFLNYNDIDWLKLNYKTAYKRIDISTLFFEKSKSLLRKGGLVSFITSNQFLSTEYGRGIRKFILESFKIEQIIDFRDLPVFEGALTYVSIFTFSNSECADFNYFKVPNIKSAQNYEFGLPIKIFLNDLSEDTWTLTSKSKINLLNKLDSFEQLGDYGNAWAGLFTGLDDVLMFDKKDMEESGIEIDLFLPVIRASDPVKNGIAEPSKYVIYPYIEDDNKTRVLSEDELRAKYPKGYDYLFLNKPLLQKRKDSRKTFKDRSDWYALTRFGKKTIFNQSKIVSPGEVKEHRFSIDNSKSGFSCARVFAITSERLNLKYLVAILNSKLIKFYIQNNASAKAGGYYSYSSKVLNSVPIINKPNKEIELKFEVIKNLNKSKNELDSKVVKYLESKFQLEKLSQKLQNWHELSFGDFIKELNKAIKTSNKQRLKDGLQEVPTLTKKDEFEWLDLFEENKQKAQTLQTQINQTDKEIDAMVYELYGLTEDEIKIVENS